MKNNIISHEMVLAKYRNGIKLLPPSYDSAPGTLDISSQLALPFNMFFVDCENKLVKVNESVAESCGFDSAKSAIGKRAIEFADKNSAEFAVRCDTHVMKHHAIHHAENDLIRIDGIIKRFFAIRIPWYGKDNKLCGLFGYAVAVGDHSLVDAIQYFQKHNFLKQTDTKNHYFSFSRRENQCAQLLLRGKTLQDISLQLNLSYRTVESYINNMKNKTNVTKKSELIEVLYNFFIEH